MRCLWLTRQDPFAANSGELIYSSGLMRALANSGASICMLGYSAADSANREETAIPQNVDLITAGPVPSRTIKNFLTSLPSDADRLRSKKLSREVVQQLSANRYDAFIVDHAALGWAIDHLSNYSGKHRPRLVYISHNCEAIVRKQIADHCQDGLAKRSVMQIDAGKYARLERRLCEAADLITSITPQDRLEYQSWLPEKKIIDLMPGYEHAMPPADGHEITADTPRRVLMVGSFEWIAKRHNLETLLAAANPVFEAEGIELQVVGKANTDYARDIENRFSCASFHANVASVEPYLKQARMGLIAETVGGGFKLKTLEYAFNRLPIAALRNALGGIELANGNDAIVEDSLPELVTSMVNHIDDFNFLNGAASETAERFAGAFHWGDRGAAFYDALRSLLPGDAENECTDADNRASKPAAIVS